MCEGGPRALFPELHSTVQRKNTGTNLGTDSPSGDPASLKLRGDPASLKLSVLITQQSIIIPTDHNPC